MIKTYSYNKTDILALARLDSDLDSSNPLFHLRLEVWAMPPLAHLLAWASGMRLGATECHEAPTGEMHLVTNLRESRLLERRFVLVSRES